MSKRNFEVEKRALIDKKTVEKLEELFKTEGEFLKEFKRFSIIYTENQDFTPDVDSPTDFRIRITGDEGKFALKYGDWRNASREEYEIEFGSKNTRDLLHMMYILNFKWGTTTYIKRRQYSYKGFVVTLDEYLGDNKFLLEVERICGTTQEAIQAEKEIELLLKKLKVESLNSEEFLRFVEWINKRKKWQFDFTKSSIEDYLDKWKGLDVNITSN